MRLEDALDNWTQISIVWKSRPSDRSAKDTVAFFEEMLREDHGVTSLDIQKEAKQYTLTYEKDGIIHTKQYHKDLAENLLLQIQSEPRYNQLFE